MILTIEYTYGTIKPYVQEIKEVKPYLKGLQSQPPKEVKPKKKKR